MRVVKLFIIGAAMAVFAGACGGGAATPDDTGAISIDLSEFKFEPNNIELKVGQTVRIVLNNSGSEAHEFMVGRDVEEGEGFPDGFHTDFFEGVEVQVSGNPTMVMAGDAMLMDGHADDGHDDGAAMDDGMAMDGDAAMDDGMAMDGDAAMDGGMAMEDEHHGFMVMQDPGSEQAVIEFVVPDKTGDWEIACFEEEGAHYEDGMKGTLTIVR